MTAAPWVLFCEADRDSETVKALIDELLRLHCVDWVREQLESFPDEVRTWLRDRGAGASRYWFDLHHCYATAASMGLSVHQGHFGDKPQRAGALTLDTIFRIVRRLHRSAPDGEKPRAVVVLWDTDNQAKDRRDGFVQAVEFGTLPPDGVEFVVALADPEREAWLVAGFVPANDNERNTLASLRSELGFSPPEQPERLTSKNATDKRDAKRVLAALSGGDDEREAQCLRIPDDATLKMLKSRGRECGLADFIEQVEQKLVPQVDPTAPSRMRRQTP